MPFNIRISSLRQTIIREKELSGVLKSFSPKEIANNIFHIVKHLNLGSSLLADDERIQLAELNLSAGQKAKQITAYETALRHITIGMALLP